MTAKKFITKHQGKVRSLPLPKGYKRGAEATAQAEDVAPAEQDGGARPMDVQEPDLERPSSPTPATSAKGKEVIRNGVMPVAIPDPMQVEDVSLADEEMGNESEAPASEAPASPAPEGETAAPPTAQHRGRGPALNYRMLHDDNLKSFFRRLTFSLDGSMLLVPAGQHKSMKRKAGATAEEPGKLVESTQNTVYVFGRTGFQK